MKTFKIGILALVSFSSFAQTIDWNHIASQAQAMTDLEFCFERVLDGKSKRLTCNQELQMAVRVGITREQASTKLFEVAKYKILRENARSDTDKELNDKIRKLILSKNVEDLLVHL